MVVTANLKGVIKLQQGSRVKVHGLQNRSELNGSIGQCLHFDPAKMRWGVELPDGKQISLKIGNLLPVDTEVSPAVPGGPGCGPTPIELAKDGGPKGEEAAGAGAAGAEAAAAEPQAPAAEPPAPAPEAAAAAEAAAPAPEAAAAPEAPQAEAAAAAVEPAAEGRAAEPAAAAEGAAQAAPDAAAAAGAEAPAAPAAAGEAGAAEGDLGAAEWEALPNLKPTQPLKTGRWFLNEAASDNFAEQLEADDPALTSLCLVPPKRFDEEDVQRICAGLEVNTHCRELLASGHSLSESGCRRIAEMLRTNKSLQLLSVGDSTLGERASLLFEGLAANTSLTNLDLELKGLTAPAGRALAEALARRASLGAPRLETLRLSRNGALGDSLEQLASGPAPRELLLFDSSLGEDRAAAIGRWAAAGIEELDLRDNSRLGTDGLELLLQTLVKKAAGKPKLRVLRLDGCAVGDDGLEALAEAAKKGLELEELFLERCEITSAGCEHVERALRGHRLKTLSVRTNTIGDAGLELIAGCAERLDVAANNLSANAMAVLGEQSIVNLELFNNPLLGQSVLAWCPELRRDHWQQLEQLDLSACLLGNVGFRLVCTALKEQPRLMPRLATLCLGGNDVEDTDEFNDLVESLAEARERPLRVIWKNT